MKNTILCLNCDKILDKKDAYGDGSVIVAYKEKNSKNALASEIELPFHFCNMICFDEWLGNEEKQPK